MMLLFGVPFVLVALYALVVAARSLGPYAQVLRRPTQPIGSITAGPVEVSGTLRARGATIEALDGTPAVALRTTIGYSYRSNAKTVTSLHDYEDVQATEIEIADATGTATVDTARVMLLGARRSFNYGPKGLRERDPALWERLPFSAMKNLVSITVEQIVVADGALGFCSGEAEAEAVVASDDYRGAKQRYRIAASLERPVILAPFPEREVRSVLLRPAHMFLAIAALSVALGSALLISLLRIGE